jgi:hypothetical protein
MSYGELGILPVIGGTAGALLGLAMIQTILVVLTSLTIAVVMRQVVHSGKPITVTDWRPTKRAPR